MQALKTAIQINWGERSLRIPYPDLAIGILGILYTVGIAGLLTNIHPDFVLLTPINLLVSLIIVLLFHPHWDRRFILFLVLCYLIGFGAEVYGVQTGRLFGSYSYSSVLGPQVWATPLMIGVNWIIMAYTSGVLVNHIAPRRPLLLKALAATLLMVGLDVLIEPVAIELNFWQWGESGVPPLQNYLGWALVAFPIQLLFGFLCGAVKNKVAVALFCFQLLFFLFIKLF